eukprot:CAMPEP_0174275200 /NCGR_PEP_ID=MMETSP0439-20130205/59697_1 /TAXON_ID=0 /ORGANISM="Stereomyxa ramosa, Strain Chinc5" /LENGTH=107 /DNA_ID=CAMNT_0015367283 /DNA_START=376 /DNA_END=696 /DNA_ORIENTATION=-
MSLISYAASYITIINVLQFGGGLLVIGAMTLFMTLGWEAFGGKGIFCIAVIYAINFVLIARYFLKQDPTSEEPSTREWDQVGGLFLTLAVGMTPLATFGFQQATGMW